MKNLYHFISCYENNFQNFLHLKYIIFKLKSINEIIQDRQKNYQSNNYQDRLRKSLKIQAI